MRVFERASLWILLAVVPLASGCVFPKKAGSGLPEFASQAPRVGERAPPLETVDLAGRPVSLADLLGEKPLVLQFGSHSCPVYRYRRFSMDPLYRDFEGRVRFVLVYTLEAHPEGAKSPYRDEEWNPRINRWTGVRIAQHRTLRERRDQARASREELGLRAEVLVDLMSDEAWRSYGRAPSSAYVIDTEGRIALRQPWVNPRGLRRTLDALLAEEAREGED